MVCERCGEPIVADLVEVTDEVGTHHYHPPCLDHGRIEEYDPAVPVDQAEPIAPESFPGLVL